MEFLEALSPELRRVFVAVAAERLRQIQAEGYSPQGDDALPSGRLANAASCYALVAGIELVVSEEQAIPISEVWGDGAATAPKTWPLDARAWKPYGPYKNLVRAIALACAELERLDRLNIDINAIATSRRPARAAQDAFDNTPQETER